MRATAFAAVAVAVTACGGGSSSRGGVELLPMPSQTFDEAVQDTRPAAVLETPAMGDGPGTDRVRARIDEPDTTHFFRTEVTRTGTLTLDTEGVDTQIEAFDVDGNQLQGIVGSLTVLITPEIADDGAIITKITPASGVGTPGNTGEYQLFVRNFVAGTGTTTPTMM